MGHKGSQENAFVSSEHFKFLCCIYCKVKIGRGVVLHYSVSVDLHGSKPLISLIPITCTVYCYQG